MAAKTGAKAAVKAAVAKPAAAPQSLEGAEKSAAAPGAGASADNANAGQGDLTGSETAEAKALREAEEQRLRDEQQARDDEAAAALLLADEMGLIEDEARAMDAVLTGEKAEAAELAKTTQTASENSAAGAVTLNAWVLPEISEFPATVTLDNNTRNRIAVAGVNIGILPYQQAEVEVTQEQFAKLAKALTSSARAHKWDNFKGLQVKYDRKD